MVQTYSDNKAVYSVDMMFVYLKYHKHPVTKINVSDLVKTLEYQGWGNPSKGIRYSALDVLEKPKKYPDDYERIINADLSYPIIITKNYIVDGVHRLTKAHLEGKKSIRAYVFDAKLMKKFKLANKTKDVWKKINRMYIYELIDLYHKRFCNADQSGGGSNDYFQKYLKYKIKYQQLKKLKK